MKKMHLLLTIFLLISSITITLSANTNAPPHPDLPNDFYADVITTLPFFGDVPGKMYYDYTHLQWRLDVSVFGQTQTDIYLYNLPEPKKFSIASGQCNAEELSDEMFPMTLPPIAEFEGYERLNGAPVELWTLEWFGIAKISYWIGNKTVSDGKVEYFLVKNKIELTSIGLEIVFQFKTVVAGPQSPRLFDVQQYNCIKPKPPVVYTLKGYVKSAVDNRIITEATVTAQGKSATTNGQGIFTLEGITGGMQKIVYSRSGYFDLVKMVNVTQDYMPGTGIDASLSPTLPAGNWRAVLTWAAQPRDLDTHVIIPGGCHVMFNNRRCIYYNSVTTLDVDATNGYGPETTTFEKVTNGVYKYYVYIYAPGDGSYVASSGRVMIYNERGLQAEVTVPTTGYPSSYKYWNVFTLNVQDSDIRLNVTNKVVASP